MKNKRIPQADRAAAYDNLRHRANDLGFTTVGEALDAIESQRK